ncbi:class I SAM-dependent methyltransferase [Clostridium saccharoperbutylacetonicum]|uniref:class I SAM-dependent methyltransferase n=1 Tax=Clostridium saccharoperbutylacetonicum TaxID=36745 RepID=UPI000983BE30|nr:class I SAM-dependent methyltransferase [Clostridium saccharoperbutylacetonicum]AQR92834.1 ubiquinone biosynthesis O-methyltransferase [Clostridium saccharoperbutylacetonicum]NSB34245.1 SAM-dependent methyltransferase [Clostridium saccharoperbutylacetonicum]
MIDDLNTYLENLNSKWSILFYRVVWEQLSHINNLKVLDYGSGFGITASHFAKNNDVLAIEPDVETVEKRFCKNNYKQIVGEIDQLKKLKDNSFDVVLCHNVLEYIKERKDIFQEFYRILKPNGIISIVKHNPLGKIMEKVVYENNVDEAIYLLNGGTINIPPFGEVNYYNINDIIDLVKDMNITIEKVLGIKTFWALQQNHELKNQQDWEEKMFDIEMKVSNIDGYINISYFNHVLLKKIS